MLEPGKKIPAFTLKQTDGTSVRSSDWKDKTVVLYFYPEDDTPGCTKQACSLRDNYGRLLKSGAVIYGISPDSVESHVAFTRKFKLPFPLLADPDHKIADKFGVWVEKNLYGKKYMGIARTTFIIKDQKVSAVIAKVDTEGHAEQILNLIQDQLTP